MHSFIPNQTSMTTGMCIEVVKLQENFCHSLIFRKTACCPFYLLLISWTISQLFSNGTLYQ